jgi:uncharacterized protein (TIGR02757 family)
VPGTPSSVFCFRRMVPLEMRDALESLYARLNRRCLVHPDPLELLYAYPDLRDREIAGLIASGLAYGRVASILRGARTVLDALGPAPSGFLQASEPGQLEFLFRGFRYRFTTGDEIAGLLHGASRLQAVHGSLGALFGTLSSRMEHAEACDALVGAILQASDLRASTLLSKTSGGSACKRLNLFLRWMVRNDEVDPGGWEGVPPARLMVPLDVHMHRAGRLLGFTTRETADWRTVVEVTRGFREYSPEDPARYDFALTRFGIRADMDHAGLEMELAGCLPGAVRGG